MGIAIFFLILLGIDALAFVYMRQLIVASGWQAIPYTIPVFWAFTVATFVLAGMLFYYMRHSTVDDVSFGFFFFVLGFISLLYLPKLNFIVFGLLHSIVSFISMPIATWIIKLGLVLAGITFVSVLYGMFVGKYDFQTKETDLVSAKIPSSFDGFKIVQISDIHIGSFGTNYKDVEKAIELINEQNPDIVVFTGDLVINFSNETNGWGHVFSKIEAKYGKYSILGNHDYGHYHNWESVVAKQANLNNLIASHKKLGFDILLNSHCIVSNGIDSLVVAGVENWGLPPFPQYGDLEKAFEGAPNEKFSILLSHDPSHWDAQVKQSGLADLTLSGHTHGFQYGIDKFGIKWSPVKYKYPKWSGLYTEGDRHLYVNVGFGVVGFPGRIGMPPEITVITLKSEQLQ